MIKFRAPNRVFRLGLPRWVGAKGGLGGSKEKVLRNLTNTQMASQLNYQKPCKAPCDQSKIVSAIEAAPKRKESSKIRTDVKDSSFQTPVRCMVKYFA